MKITWFRICIILISIMILWTGCRRQSAVNTPEILGSETPILPTITSTTTIQPPTPTQKAFTVTQQYTATSTPVPTITPPPYPTLSQSERQLYLEEHLPTNNGCKLPCWLGITPGKTTWQEAKDFLTYLGITRIGDEKLNESIFHGLGGFDFENPRIFHRFSILEQYEKVKSIFLDVEGYYATSEFTKIWKYYDPRNLIREYGPPTKVWFDTLSISPGDKHGYILIIAYDNQGIIVRYEGFLTEIGSIFRVCPRFEENQDIIIMKVYLQAPEDPQPLEELGGIGDWQWLFDRSKRIEEAAGLSEEQFYKLFTQNIQPACFDTPADIWPEY